MTDAIAPDRTSRLRRVMLVSCAALLAALWFMAATRPGVATALDFWPVKAWAMLGVATSVFSRSARQRRLHFTLAALLLASTWALPSWHLLMPKDAWIAANEPAKAGLAQLQATWAAQAAWLIGLEWVPGLWRACWPGFVLLMPACIAVLLLPAVHPLLPPWRRHLAKAGIFAWLLAAFAGVGTWLSTAMSSSPTWFWAVLVVGLLFQLRRGQVAFVLTVWSLCAAVLVTRLVSLVVPPDGFSDHALALAFGLSVAWCLAWYTRMESIPPHDLVLEARREAALPALPHETPAPAFDLIEHLDSPQAQEGADKYTRE